MYSSAESPRLRYSASCGTEGEERAGDGAGWQIWQVSVHIHDDSLPKSLDADARTGCWRLPTQMTDADADADTDRCTSVGSTSLVPLARALALTLAQERESRLVLTEDRARLLPNPLLALGSSVLFKDKAPCGLALDVA